MDRSPRDLQLLQSVLVEEGDVASFVQEDLGHLHGLDHHVDYQRE